MTVTEMRERTQTLLKKSASDEAALNLDGISPQIAAFHGQQAIEKLFKAWLFALGEDPPKTHSLRRLMGLLELRGCAVPNTPIMFEDFNDYAVQWRYQDVPEAGRLDPVAMRRSVLVLREYIKTCIDEIEKQRLP
jgi:HEPN domain-containing protein